MSNSYMGPKDPKDFRRPVRNYSPEDQWEDIRVERQKEIDLNKLADGLAKIEKIQPPPPSDDFEIGGAL